MKCLTHSRGPAHKATGADTSPVLKGPKQSPPSSRVPSPISFPHLEPTGPGNKENCEENPKAGNVLLSEDGVILNCSSVAEDSGYISLHSSQLEHWDGDFQYAETPERGIEEQHCRISAVHSDSKSSCLPVLRFAEDVCSELAKSFMKSQSYDWTVINTVAERYDLQKIIGAKMGLEYMDVLCALYRKDMKHILSRILGLLGDCDLISCTKVSKTWRKIIHQDKSAGQRCKEGEERLRDAETCTGSFTRDFALNRVVFSCLQNVASSTPSHKSIKKSHSQKDIKPSRFNEFHEAAKSLKVHEALRSCRRCGSPARYDPGMQRAVCLRASCGFDFCSLCQSMYHGSTQCPTGVVRPSTHWETAHLAGSARSKRSIRRL